MRLWVSHTIDFAGKIPMKMGHDAVKKTGWQSESSRNWTEKADVSDAGTDYLGCFRPEMFYQSSWASTNGKPGLLKFCLWFHKS